MGACKQKINQHNFKTFCLGLSYPEVSFRDCIFFQAMLPRRKPSDWLNSQSPITRQDEFEKITKEIVLEAQGVNCSSQNYVRGLRLIIEMLQKELMSKGEES